MGFTEGVTAAALSPDGTLAAAVSTDRTLRLFGGLARAGEPGAPPLPNPGLLHLPLDSGTALSFGANSRNVLVATAQGRKLLACSLAPKLALKKEFPASGAAHAKPMCAALLAPNSRWIVTVGADDDTHVKLWTLGGELLGSAATKQAAHYGASISADSRLVAIAASSSTSDARSVAPRHGQVPLFEVCYRGDAPVGLELVHTIGGHTKGVRGVSFASNCVHLALASRDGEWSVVRTDRGDVAEVARGAAPGGVPFERVALSPFAKRLVGATASTLSLVATAAGGGVLAVFDTFDAGHGVTRALCYSSDGLRVLSGGDDGRLRLWRVANEEDKAGTL